MQTTQELKAQIIQKAWEDATFKKQLLEDPKTAIKEAFGVELPVDFQVTTVEETTSQFYVVIPSELSDAWKTAHRGADYG